MDLSKEEIKTLFKSDELTTHVLRVVQKETRDKCLNCYLMKKKYCLHDRMSNDMVLYIVNTHLNVLDDKMRSNG
jgi:hypothetical protein